MKKLILTLLLSVVSMALFAQATHDLFIIGGLDIIKTDNVKAFDKAQLGFEGNYFVVRNFSVGVGGELWTQKQTDSFVLGLRWYADDHLFFRLRGLIGANDANLGIVWSKPLNEKWRFEGIGDFYFNQSAFALRAGVSYVIRK